MRTVYLILHRSKPNVRALLLQLIRAFQGGGIAVSCEPWLMQQMDAKQAAGLLSEEGAAPDAVVSVGGDGTFLRASQFAAKNDIPLFGINMGRTGFLAEVELEQLDEVCRRLKEGAFTVESRMMLEASLGKGETLLALNDIVVSRGGYARLIAIKVWVDQELVGRYHADGLIVSSPTGSTGYSLSAGGPIVFPGVECMILCPICAHSLQHRPVVISSRQTVTLELDCEPQQRVQLSADGQEALPLSAQQKIVITRSGTQVRFIHFFEQDFFSIIRQKLSEWSC